MQHRIRELPPACSPRHAGRAGDCLLHAALAMQDGHGIASCMQPSPGRTCRGLPQACSHRRAGRAWDCLMHAALAGQDVQGIASSMQPSPCRTCTEENVRPTDRGERVREICISYDLIGTHAYDNVMKTSGDSADILSYLI